MTLDFILLVFDLLIVISYPLTLFALKTRNSCLVILDCAVNFLDFSCSFSGFLCVYHFRLHLSSTFLETNIIERVGRSPNYLSRLLICLASNIMVLGRIYHGTTYIALKDALLHHEKPAQQA